MIRDTSIIAYHNMDDIGERQKEVYRCISMMGQACNIEISEELGLPINSITGRTRELVKKGYVEKLGKKMSPTGKRATYWRIKRDRSEPDWDEMRRQDKQRIAEIERQEVMENEATGQEELF